MIARSLILLILCFSFLMPLQSQQQSKGKHKRPDWSKPDRIDPLNPDLPYLIKVDTQSYKQKAIGFFRAKKYRKAAQYYLYVLRHDHTDFVTAYNLACCYGLLGEAELASRFLIRSVEGGFTAFKRIREEKDFDKVRNKKVFRSVSKQLLAMEQSRGRIFYVKAKKLVKCRVQLPENYEKGKKYRVLIGLHGNGGSSEGFIRLWSGFKRRDFIFVTPEGAYPRQLLRGGKGMYSWEIPVRDERLWAMGDPLTVESIMEVVKQVKQRFNPQKVYLMGFSQGAAYTYITGLKHSDMFDGIIAIGGLLPPVGKGYSVHTKEDLERSKGLRVMIAHGKQDNVMKRDHSINARKELEKYGYKVEFHLYRGGHSLPSEILGKINDFMK